jgi:hypothetical protein
MPVSCNTARASQGHRQLLNALGGALAMLVDQLHDGTSLSAAPVGRGADGVDAMA